MLLAAVTCCGKQIYDANIVDTMMTGSIRRVLTHNSDRARRIALDLGLTSKVGEPAQTPAEQKDEYHQGPNANSKSIKPASRQDLVWHLTAL
jgi:hypothetical protein